MSYSHAATYREREVRSASPGKLVVLVYDHILASLARARAAHKLDNVEQRIDAVSKARDGITELFATLDMDKGGAIAQQLRSLYSFALTQLADSGVRFDDRKIERIAAMIAELRDAFATISEQSATVTAA